MLLAEANQWPEDVLPYFGDGDECHMAFHFPVMPRMYMAIAQEDRHPMADILRQTPDIPSNCQWGIFLRNHDELTLEMVTDRERDYLWNVYAADQRMRLNLGIRRRLAPLMDNDLRKIQLMNSLLLSMPGTPIIYYGDEIGMGDNIFLGDRDGVRTPMQWSPDRNGGFSRADPAAAVPAADHGSDLWLRCGQRRGAAARPIVTAELDEADDHRPPAAPAFGRGTLRLLYPRNRKILAYLREHRRRQRSCASPICRAPPRRSSSTSASSAARCRSRCWAQPVPADRRSALPADAARLRLLLVRARRGGRAAALARAHARAAARLHHAGHARWLDCT